MEHNLAAEKMARELAKDSIVTKVLGRFIYQIMEAIHDDEIKPLRDEIARYRSALETIKLKAADKNNPSISFIADQALRGDVPSPMRDSAVLISD